MTTPEQSEGKTPERPKRGEAKNKKETPQSPIDTDKIAEKIVGSGRMISERIEETEQETASRLRVIEADAEAERTKKGADAKAERDEKEAAMNHRRRVEIIALCAYLGISGFVAVACLWVLADKTIAPQDKAWVGPTLTLVIGGVAGYLTGRSSGRPPEK